MKPETQSFDLLGVTRSKAKMYEYSVPAEDHIRISQDPARLFRLAIGILGDISAAINSELDSAAQIATYGDQLRFAARFFDAYLGSKLDTQFDSYLMLLTSAAYYLCDLPGSSAVLARRAADSSQDPDAMNLEQMLLWLLRGQFSDSISAEDGLYAEDIASVAGLLRSFSTTGQNQDMVIAQASRLREAAYRYGSPRQLLLADIISALVRKRLENSVWIALPAYSGLTADQWSDAFKKDTFIRELWPAQHLLGINDVFKGKSAVIQMPTSAGKTKSTEILIRSSFISGRADIAVVVAPFRALCHEIKNALLEAFSDESVFIDDPSDVFQVDFDVDSFLALGIRKKILVITPEKLTYLLRHSPELAQRVRLLIYDEGHQFDSGSRGVTYELLLSSLKSMVGEDVQTILISAVLSNAGDVGEWLNGKDGAIVSGTNLTPTYRSVAFTSWRDRLGRLEFVRQDNPDSLEFFVPRIIEQQQLNLRPRERKDQFFPEKGDGTDIALYLGMKLVNNGSVAIFCGKKDTVRTLAERCVDVYERGLQFSKPLEYSNQEEVSKLHFLHVRNLGSEYSVTRSAELGFFSHSANTPHGLRLCIEYGMQQASIKYVFCTSTLAQGVNLPIRYLIVTSVYQAQQVIKTRDFHNLMGRAGRSGMHTEGTVLFADPQVFDNRTTRDNAWRWNQIKRLLDPSNSEPCASTLLSFFEPWLSDNRRLSTPFNMLEFVSGYYANVDLVSNLLSTLLFLGYSYQGISAQVEGKIRTLSSVESFLLANITDNDTDSQTDTVLTLAQNTLAYFLSSEDQKEQVVQLFRLLSNYIRQRVPDGAKRRIYGSTLYGLLDSIEIEDWVSVHVQALLGCGTDNDLLSVLWPLMQHKIGNRTFRNCDASDAVLELTARWIQGQSFHELYDYMAGKNVRLNAGTQKRAITIENIIDICENALAFEGTLVIGAVVEFLTSRANEAEAELLQTMQDFQKRLRYGLPTPISIALYEIGFSDRVVASDLSSMINPQAAYRRTISQYIRRRESELRSLLAKYPAYFSYVLDNIMNGTTAS